jgi:hypothetical protein
LIGRLKVIPGGGGGGIGRRLAFGIGGIATAVATVASRTSILCKQIMLGRFVTVGVLQSVIFFLFSPLRHFIEPMSIIQGS